MFRLIKIIIILGMFCILGYGFWAFGLEAKDKKEIKEFIMKKYLNK